MARLDTDKQKEIEPKRMLYAMERIKALGYEITHETDTWFTFAFKGWPVKMFPYSGWHTGRTIQDGRGLQKLLDQIKPLKQ